MRPLGESAMPRDARRAWPPASWGRAAGGDRRRRNPTRGGPTALRMRIGEIDVARFAHYDIAGRVEPLAFPLVRQHFDLALLVGAGHATQARLAGVETAVGVEGVAAGAMSVRAEDFGGMAGSPFQKAVAGVSLKSVAIFGPSGPSVKRKPSASLVNVISEKSCAKARRRKGPRRDRFGRSGSFPRAFVLQLDVVDYLFDALHLFRDLGGFFSLNFQLHRALSVTTPCFTSTSRPPPLTTGRRPV